MSGLSRRFHTLRGEVDVEDFVSVLMDNSIFIRATSAIHADTVRWAESCGIGKKKEPKIPEGMSEIETLVYKYFSSRKQSVEEARDRADLIDLILDIVSMKAGVEFDVTPHKFIPVASSKGGSSNNVFRNCPRWTAVIPTGNSNGHDYKIGVVAVKATFMSPGRFCNSRNGIYGNTMTPEASELAIPDLEQLQEAFAKTFYYNGDFIDSFFGDFE